MFWWKHHLGSLLMPLPVGLAVILAGTLLVFRHPERRLGRWLVLAGALWLVAASTGGPWRWAAEALEDREPPTRATWSDEDAPKLVVVLGAGHRDRRDLPVTSQLSEPAMVRVVEGVRQWRTLPDARLVFTGTVDAGRIREPEAMADLAMQLGVPRERIVIEGQSLDTDDHARYLQAIVGEQPFLLVTSAVHLPRATLLFRQRGMHPLPVPAGRISLPTEGWGPSAATLERSTRTAHEALGLAWAHLVRALRD